MIIYLKYLTSFLTFAMAYGFGFIPLNYQSQSSSGKSLNHINLFADGIFVGIAILHLLPESLETARLEMIPSTYIYLTFFVSILLLAIFPYLAETATSSKKSHRLHAHVFLILLSFHALLEGLCLGLSKNLETTFFLIFALLIHKGLESFALILNQARFILSRSKLLTILVFFSSMTPLGIIAGMWGGTPLISDSSLAYFNAITAGTFIYMVLNCQCELNGIKRSDAMFIMFGFSLIAFVNVFTQHS